MKQEFSNYFANHEYQMKNVTNKLINIIEIIKNGTGKKLRCGKINQTLQGNK